MAIEYKVNGKVYLLVPYLNGKYSGCTGCDLLGNNTEDCNEAPCGGGYFVEKRMENNYEQC